MFDGLEPLQYEPGLLAAQLRDPALGALLSRPAQQKPGLRLMTSGERVADLSPFRDTTAPLLKPQHLSIPAGLEILKTLGVSGTPKLGFSANSKTSAAMLSR